MSDQRKNEQNKSNQPGATAPETSSEQQKSNASAAGKAAADAGADVGRQARQAASDIAGKVEEGASDASVRLRDAVEEQKAVGVERAKGIASAISRAADELDDEIPQGAHYVRRAAEELDHLSDEFRDRDARELFGIVQDFTRRQPTVVLAATALAGFAAVRFFMTSPQPHQKTSAVYETEPDRMRPGSATASGSPPRPGGVSTSAPSSMGASKAQGPSTSSGDPGGLSPQAPASKPKPSGSGYREA